MPFPESLPPRERLEAQFNLSAQWKEQISALNESGVLEILPESRDLGIVGKEYPIPRAEAISDRLAERYSDLEPKLSQGLNCLLLSPFGTPMDPLIAVYRDLLLQHFKEHKLFSA